MILLQKLAEIGNERAMQRRARAALEDARLQLVVDRYDDPLVAWYHAGSFMTSRRAKI